MRNNTLGQTLAALIWQKREPYEMNISGQYFFHVNSSICSISLGNPFVHIPLDDAQWSASSMEKTNVFLILLRIKLMRFYARFSSLACFLS